MFTLYNKEKPVMKCSKGEKMHGIFHEKEIQTSEEFKAEHKVNYDLTMF